MLACRTAKGDSYSLTYETTVALGDFKPALGWAYAQVQTGAREQQSSLPVNEAEAADPEASSCMMKDSDGTVAVNSLILVCDCLAYLQELFLWHSTE